MNTENKAVEIEVVTEVAVEEVAVEVAVVEVAVEGQEVAVESNTNEKVELSMENTTVAVAEEVVAVEVSVSEVELMGKSRLELQAIIKGLKDEGYEVSIYKKSGLLSKKELVQTIIQAKTEVIEAGEVEVISDNKVVFEGQVEGTNAQEKAIALLNSEKQVVELLNKAIPHHRLNAQGFVVNDLARSVPGTLSARYEEIVSPAIGNLWNGKEFSRFEDVVGNIFNIEFQDNGAKHGRSLAYGGFVRQGEFGPELLYATRSLSRIITKLYNVTTGKYEEYSEEAVAGLTEIFVAGASPSGVRQLTFTFGTKEVIEALEIKADEWYLGAYSLTMKALKGNKKKAANAMARLSSRLTDQIALGYINTIAIYTDNLAQGKTDGTSYISVNRVKEMIEKDLAELLGMKIETTIEAVKNMGLQTRPATNKDQAIAKIDRAINAIVSELVANGVNLQVVQRKDMTAEKSSQLLAMKNTLIIVTNDNNFVLGNTRIDFLTDQNAMKLDYNLGCEIPLWVLKAVKAKDSATLTGQVYSKFVHLASQSEQGISLLKKFMKKEIDKLLQTANESVAEGNFVSESKLGTSDITGVAKGIVTEELLEFLPFLERSIIASKWKEVAKAIASLRAPVKGQYLTAEIDIAVHFLAEGILPADAVFIKNGEKMELEKMLLVKFPSVHFREFLLANVWTLKDIKDALSKEVAAGNLSEKNADVIYTDYAMQAESTIVVSGDDTLKQLLAGFDTDTDAFMAFYEEEIIELMEATKTKPLAVMIEKDDNKVQDTKEYALDMSGYGDSVFNTLNVKGISIGEATYTGEVISSILTYTTTGSLTVLRGLFGGNGTKEYKGLRRGTESMFESVYVNEVDANEVIESLQAGEVMFTEENYVRVVEDLVAIVRYMQEVSIDAAKTGFVSKIVMKLRINGKRVANELHQKVTNIGMVESVLSYEVKSSGNSYYLRNNKMNNVRMELLEEARQQLQDRLDSLPELTHALAEQIQNAIPKEYKSSMIAWQSAYFSVQNEYRSATELRYDEDTMEFSEVSDEELKVARARRKKGITMIANAIRLGTSELSPLQRGLMMLAKSLLDNNGNLKDSLGNSFYTVLPIEFFLVIADFAKQLENGSTKNAGFVGEKITVVEKFNNEETIGGELKHGSKIEFDENGNCVSHHFVTANGSKKMTVLSDLNLAGHYIAVKKEVNGVVKWSAIRPIENAVYNTLNRHFEDNKNDDSVIVSAHYKEDKEKVFAELQDQTKVIITTGVNGNFIRLEDGTPVAGISLPNTDNALARKMNGQLFDLTVLELRKTDSGQNLIIGVENGVYVDGNFAKPKTLLVNPTEQRQGVQARKVAPKTIAQEENTLSDAELDALSNIE